MTYEELAEAESDDEIEKLYADSEDEMNTPAIDLRVVKFIGDYTLYVRDQFGRLEDQVNKPNARAMITYLNDIYPGHSVTWIVKPNLRLNGI